MGVRFITLPFSLCYNLVKMVPLNECSSKFFIIALTVLPMTQETMALFFTMAHGKEIAIYPLQCLFFKK